MSYNLFICRHAQAQAPVFNQPDYARNLTEQGILEATKAGQWLWHEALRPDLIVCSSARRTLSTASLIAGKLGCNENEILSYPELYNASAAQLLTFLEKLDKRYQVVLLVGHNPGVSELIATLSNTYRGNVPTGSVHHFWFEMADWNELAVTSAKGYRTNVPFTY